MASDIDQYEVSLEGILYRVSVCDGIDPDNIAQSLAVRDEEYEEVSHNTDEGMALCVTIGRMILDEHPDVTYQGGYCSSGTVWGPDRIKYDVDWDNPAHNDLCDYLCDCDEG